MNPTHDQLDPSTSERHHCNGAVAHVSRSEYLGFTSYRAMSYRVNAIGAVTDVKVVAGFQTAGEAQKAADRLAHDGCSGQGCGEW